MDRRGSFKVTERTIFRNLDALRDAEIPSNTDRGRGGGITLDRSYALPPVNFKAREAALIIAGCSWRANVRILPFTETLGGALDKVRAAQSASAQSDLLRQLETLRFVGVPAHATKPEVLRAVEQARPHPPRPFGALAVQSFFVRGHRSWSHPSFLTERPA